MRKPIERFHPSEYVREGRKPIPDDLLIREWSE
jgi:hypothetical protein